jgi:bla regulator protein BlaR1
MMESAMRNVLTSSFVLFPAILILELTLITPIAGRGSGSPGTLIAAQTTATHDNPAFEVVSIRGHPRGYWPTFERKQITPDGLAWINAQTQALITFAYDLRDPKLQIGLIPGAPTWIRSEWFDIRAKMSESDIAKLKDSSSQDREAYARRLVQTLLADRFNLKAHLVSKQGLSYEIVLAKNGPKHMKVAPANEAGGITTIDSGYLQYHGTPLSALLLILPQMLGDTPVVDKTGLTRTYDFELKWDREPGTFSPGSGIPLSPADGSRPPIFKALEDQLGLRLVPVRGPLKGIVIDHIERPSPN